MNKKNKSAAGITKSAIIAALYVILTLLSSSFGLSSGAVQIRISEMLTVLPMFTFDAVPGLFIGCILSNVITGGVIWDTVFGSIATLIGAYGTYLLRKKSVYVAQIPPVVSNMLIVPFVLKYAYGVSGAVPFFMLTVGTGEIISAWIMGILLYKVIIKYRVPV